MDRMVTSRQSRPVCAVCRTPLAPHQAAAGTTCGDLRCRTALAVRSRQERERHVAAAKAAALAHLGLPDQTAPVGVVPFADRPLAPLDPARAAAFRAYLESSLAEAAARREPEPPSPSWPDTERPDDPVLARAVATACSTCRGACCERGNTHAFLSADEMALKLAALPGATPESLAEEYLSRLPEEAVLGGCVFQGAQGCVLPRPMRAGICNGWTCRGLADWIVDLRSAQGGPGWVVSLEGTTPRRASPFDGSDGPAADEARPSS